MAPQGAAARSSALSCVTGCHKLSRLNHSGRWVWAGSPAVHPMWDHRGPEQQSRPPRPCLGASSETRARVGTVRGAHQGCGGRMAGLFSAAAFSGVGHFPTGLLAEGRPSFPRELLKPAPLFR